MEKLTKEEMLKELRKIELERIEMDMTLRTLVFTAPSGRLFEIREQNLDGSSWNFSNQIGRIWDGSLWDLSPEEMKLRYWSVISAIKIASGYFRRISVINSIVFLPSPRCLWVQSRAITSA